MTAAWKKHVRLLFVGWVVVIATYLETFVQIFFVWWSSVTYNHCLLIPVISAYLFYERRQEILIHRPAVAKWAILYLAANSLWWLFGEFAGTDFFRHVAIIGNLIAVAWLTLGTRVFKAALFPFFYLYFAVPEGEFLVPYLQDSTAEIVVTMLRMFNFPVYMEGRLITIPSGNFVVAQACSGINYLLASVSVGSMYAYLRYRSYWRRFVFMLLAILVPLVANGVRAFGIIVIADLSDYTLAMGIDHFIYGWVFFGVVISVLFYVGSLFAEDGAEPTRQQTDPVPPMGAQPSGKGILAVAVIIVAAPAAVSAVLERTTQPAPEITIPTVSGWPLVEHSDFIGGDFKYTDQKLGAVYRMSDEAEPVYINIHYFNQQVGDKELIKFGNQTFSSRRFNLVEYGTSEQHIPGYDHGRMNEFVLRANSEDYLVWYWYEVDGITTASDLGAKFAQFYGRLLGRREGSAAFVVATPVTDGSGARTRLNTFLQNGHLRLESLRLSSGALD